MRPEDWTNIVREMTPLRAAFEGALMGDALAMPVHWYYDTEALKRDYGTVDDYVAPKNPHAGSILWRSTYQPVNEKADILRGQAKYWASRRGAYFGKGACVAHAQKQKSAGGRGFARDASLRHR